MKIWWGALAGALLFTAACDALRYPGDGSDDEYRAETPPGAPGPAPPSEPVTDPYGDDDTSEVETPAGEPDGETVTPSAPDTAPDLPDSPDASIPDPDTETPDTSTPDVTDPAEPGDTDIEPQDPSAGDPATDPDEPVTEPGTEPETDVEPDTGSEPGTETETPAGTDSETDTGTDPSTDPADVADTPVTPEPEPTVVFSYVEPGQLLPGSGTGATERDAVFAPDIRFPIKAAPAYLQSQVWMFGGGIKGGDQCDPRNFEYPWRDNFCETRSSNRNSPYCPVSKIHQGQDIRVGTPQGCNQLRSTPAAQRDQYEVVATEDGVIQSIGTYTVTMRSGPRIYKYMHMNMAKLQVASGDTVTKGQTLGYVSNDFGGTPTTYHLHFELLQNTAESGWVHVPPYTSLVAAYERRENGVGERIEPNIAIASTPPPIPEGFEIIE